MTWLNSDGLFVKFGTEEAAIARGGQTANVDGNYTTIFYVDYRDALSASTAILGSVAGPDIVGSQGVMLPKGLVVHSVEVLTETAPTSSGTVATANLVLGLIREDRTTELDYDGISTTSFVIGTVLESEGERVNLAPGVTGAGALLGKPLANDGLITISNSQHGSHPYTAGKWRVTVKGHFTG